MAQIYKLILDLTEKEGREFEKELKRRGGTKVDLFREAWANHKAMQKAESTPAR